MPLLGCAIHVTFRSNVPAILRPPLQPAGTIGSRKDYEFVGNYYVHGIMDGEALADETLDVDDIMLC